MSNTNYFLNHTGAQLDEAIQKVLDGYVPSSEVDAAYENGKTEVISKLQVKTVTPNASQQVIEADSNYYGLSKVTVNALPTNSGGTYTSNQTLSVNGKYMTGDIVINFPVVNSITTEGTYDDADHHGGIFGAIDQSGNLLLVVEGGTSTSYENVLFNALSVPDGVTLANYSYPSYASNQASRAHVAVFSGVTGSVNLALAFNTHNGTYDRVTCDVTMTYV